MAEVPTPSVEPLVFITPAITVPLFDVVTVLHFKMRCFVSSVKYTFPFLSHVMPAGYKILSGAADPTTSVEAVQISFDGAVVIGYVEGVGSHPIEQLLRQMGGVIGDVM